MLRIEGLIYRIAGRAVIDGASFALPEGHRAALVGRNDGDALRVSWPRGLPVAPAYALRVGPDAS